MAVCKLKREGDNGHYCPTLQLISPVLGVQLGVSVFHIKNLYSLFVPFLYRYCPQPAPIYSINGFPKSMEGFQTINYIWRNYIAKSNKNLQYSRPIFTKTFNIYLKYAIEFNDKVTLFIF